MVPGTGYIIMKTEERLYGKMGHYKKFTDFLAGFSAFAALIYIFRQYMSFKDEEITSTVEKLKTFFGKDFTKDYREYLILIAIIVIAVAAGRIFAKFPVVSFVFSLLPMIEVLRMFNSGILYERPMIYVMISLLFVSGNVVEAICRDREDGGRRHRAFVQANSAGIIIAGISFFLYYRTEKLSALAEDAVEELNKFDLHILTKYEMADMKVYLVIGIMALVTVAVSLIFRGAYFIDLPLAAVPFVYTVIKWNQDLLTVHPMLMLVPVTLYFLVRIAVFASEPPFNVRNSSKQRLAEKNA